MGAPQGNIRINLLLHNNCWSRHKHKNWQSQSRFKTFVATNLCVTLSVQERSQNIDTEDQYISVWEDQDVGEEVNWTSPNPKLHDIHLVMHTVNCTMSNIQLMDTVHGCTPPCYYYLGPLSQRVQLYGPSKQKKPSLASLRKIQPVLHSVVHMTSSILPVTGD